MKKAIKNQKWFWVTGIITALIVTGSDGNKDENILLSENVGENTFSIQREDPIIENTNEEGIVKQDEPSSPDISVTTAIIDYVIDGDTVNLRNRESIRLIGINTPEMGQPYSSEAKAKLKELVEGKSVILEKDITDRDQYNRLLRYIWLDDVLINLEMVRLGYANSYSYPPDIKYQDEIVEAEREARTQGIGLWSSSEDSSCVIISYMNADADGNDNYNLNDEYIIFKNVCSEGLNVTGWTIKDEATHIFTFPSFYFAPQATITLYSGSGTNTTDRLYWNRVNESHAIWNNTGDTVYLRDIDGDLVLEYNY